MTSRREFIQVAAVASLPAIASSSATVRDDRTQSRTHVSLHAVVIDERHAESLVLGTKLANAGASVLAMSDGDVTHLWLREIGPAWRQQPVAIAGLTARPALFCLEQLAIASGLRVVFHAEHIVYADGRVTHAVLRNADSAFLSARDLKRAGDQWPARVAHVVANYRKLEGRVRPGRSDAALDPALPPGAQLLTSWVIAAA